MKYSELAHGGKKRFDTNPATASEVYITMHKQPEPNFIIETNWHGKEELRDLILQLIELYKSMP